MEVGGLRESGTQQSTIGRLVVKMLLTATDAQEQYGKKTNLNHDVSRSSGTLGYCTCCVLAIGKADDGSHDILFLQLDPDAQGVIVAWNLQVGCQLTCRLLV